MITVKKYPRKETHIAFILDESGSMECVSESTIASFNEFLGEHRKHHKKGGDVYLSLVKFSGTVNETFFDVPILNVNGELSEEDYNPDGSTALYDAIGHTIQKLDTRNSKGDIAYLVIILSDGQENASKKFSGQKIRERIRELEATGKWTFQYVGCDQLAIKEAASLGLKTFTFEKSKQGLDEMSRGLAHASTLYYSARAAGACSVENFMDDDSNPLRNIQSKSS